MDMNHYIGLFLNPKFVPGSVITRIYPELEYFHLKTCYFDEPIASQNFGKESQIIRVRTTGMPQDLERTVQHLYIHDVAFLYQA